MRCEASVEIHGLARPQLASMPVMDTMTVKIARLAQWEPTLGEKHMIDIDTFLRARGVLVNLMGDDPNEAVRLIRRSSNAAAALHVEIKTAEIELEIMFTTAGDAAFGHDTQTGERFGGSYARVADSVRELLTTAGIAVDATAPS